MSSEKTGAAIPSLPFSEIPSSNVSLVFLSFISPLITRFLALNDRGRRNQLTFEVMLGAGAVDAFN